MHSAAKQVFEIQTVPNGEEVKNTQNEIKMNNKSTQEGKKTAYTFLPLPEPNINSFAFLCDIFMLTRKEQQQKKNRFEKPKRSLHITYARATNSDIHTGHQYCLLINVQIHTTKMIETKERQTERERERNGIQCDSNNPHIECV